MHLIFALRSVLRDPALDPAFKALALVAPGEGYIAEQLAAADPQRIHAVREHWLALLAAQLHDDWVWAGQSCSQTGGRPPVAAAPRCRRG